MASRLVVENTPPTISSLNCSPLRKVIVFVFAFLALAILQAAVHARPAETAAQREFLRKLSAAAIERTHYAVRYDPSYVRIPYPRGDVPSGTGVCTDEVIRAYRALGIDLQRVVHEDMLRNFSAYPDKSIWSLAHPDTNIDHRRVPNLIVFFKRKGDSLPTTTHAEDYSPGDLVTWDLGGNVPHIGIVVDHKSPQSGRYMVVHNIGQGPKMEDVLFDWKITGHFRYFGQAAQ